MNKIKAYTSMDERNKVHKYRTFDIIDKLPEVGDWWSGSDYEVIEINPVRLDCEQGNDEVYNYDYFEIVYRLRDCEPDEIDENTFSDYVAVEKPEPEYEDEDEE